MTNTGRVPYQSTDSTFSITQIDLIVYATNFFTRHNIRHYHYQPFVSVFVNPKLEFQHFPKPLVYTVGGRRSISVGVTSNSSGPIDSPLMQSMQSKIKEELNAEFVTVNDAYGDGRHVRNAWHKLGAMPPEEAMQKYLEIITKLYPTWAGGSTSKRTSGESNEPSSKDTRPMGSVFSSFVHEEESGNELKLGAIHDFAREGDIVNLLKCVEGDASVDTKDSEGRTPLHWAVDRGNIDVTESLLSRNADVNVKDNEGQTPLHYAAVCEREAIAELLVKKNAGKDIKDDDGSYLSDLCDSNWPS